MSVAEQRECPVCGDNRRETVFEVDAFRLVQCPTCNLMTKDIGALSRSRVQSLQDVVYEDIQTRLMVQDVHTRIAHSRLDVLKRVMDGGRLLEIGCATGEFLEAAGQGNFDILGIDASDIYTEYAISRGIPIFNGRLEDAGLGEEQFDAVAMFHLIEHLEHPPDFLARVADLLRCSGYVLLSTPNLPAVTHRMLGYRHPNFHQEDHLYFFSAQTLDAMLRKSGFTDVEIISIEHPHTIFTALYGLLARSLKHRGTPNTGLGEFRRAVTNGRLRRAMKRSPYLAAAVLKPLLRIYGRHVEKKGLGHELVALARKR